MGSPIPASSSISYALSDTFALPAKLRAKNSPVPPRSLGDSPTLPAKLREKRGLTPVRTPVGGYAQSPKRHQTGATSESPEEMQALFDQTTQVLSSEPSSSYTSKEVILRVNGNCLLKIKHIAGIPTNRGKIYQIDGVAQKARLIYKGGIQNEIPHGFGKSYYPETGQVKYDGSFDNSMRQGKGTAYDPDGTLTYTGSYKNGRPHGDGKYILKNGAGIYEGQFEDGRFHGRGILSDTRGNMFYNGKFEDGMPTEKFIESLTDDF